MTACRVPTLLVALILVAVPTWVSARCADNVAQLRSLLTDPAFPLTWEETGMSDGRPLIVTIDDRSGSLFISFAKAGTGLMAEGPARICQEEQRLNARFALEGLQLGPAAHWLLRTGLRAGSAVSLHRRAAAQLRIGAAGWSGDFVPGSGVGLRASDGDATPAPRLADLRK